VPGPEGTEAAGTTVPHDDRPGGELSAQLASMIELAHRGEWQGVEGLAAGIRAMAATPAADRDGLAAARAEVDRTLALARAARNEIGEKLAAIRHGRKAMASYRATGGLRGR
jgi:hypothetical protein